MRRIGIVGHEAAKFTLASEEIARALIRDLLAEPTAVLVSGHCHLGGVDIYAEEIADELGREKLIFPPAEKGWERGYKPRNIQIADHSTEVRVIVVTEYPESYQGIRFGFCYHCGTDNHIKSGGCWTAKRAQRAGKPAFWHEIGAGWRA